MKKHAAAIILIALLAFSGSPLHSAIILPTILGDNMVLQQKTKVNLWGKSDQPGKIKVVTSWNNRQYVVPISASEWKLEVETPEAGGPYSILLDDGQDKVSISNVLIGEVWLCSGQSNMEMPIKGFQGEGVNGMLDVLLQATPDNQIHFVKVNRQIGINPKFGFKGQWMCGTAEEVSNFSATAYFFGQYLRKTLNVPIGLICSAYNGSSIQPWLDKETLQLYPEVSLEVLNTNEKDILSVKNHNKQPTFLFNGMIEPVKNFTIKGAIWYQGESNRQEPALYKKLFPEMVSLWRRKWGIGDFPFYYVQIAPFCVDNCDGFENARMRQVQLECLNIIPNSGMVVLADKGSASSVHPPYKEEVGKRLALWALSQTYDVRTPYSGPLFESAKADCNKVTISFSHTELGLATDGNDIVGFELAGADKVFYPSKASIVANRSKISLTNDRVADPKFVRFGYRNYQPLNLYNTFMLPASPFEAVVE